MDFMTFSGLWLNPGRRRRRGFPHGTMVIEPPVDISSDGYISTKKKVVPT